MFPLESIKKKADTTGTEPGQVVRVITTEPVGDNAIAAKYKNSDGRLLKRMLFRTDEADLSLAEVGRSWAFDAPRRGLHAGGRGLYILCYSTVVSPINANFATWSYLCPS